MKKLRCKKEYGIWYYKKVFSNDFDGPIYELYNDKLEIVFDFAYYSDMKYYIETGVII